MIWKSSSHLPERKKPKLWLPTSLVSVHNTDPRRRTHRTYHTLASYSQCGSVAFPTHHREVLHTRLCPTTAAKSGFLCTLRYIPVEIQTFYIHGSSLQQPWSHMWKGKEESIPALKVFLELTELCQKHRVQIYQHAPWHQGVTPHSSSKSPNCAEPGRVFGIMPVTHCNADTSPDFVSAKVHVPRTKYDKRCRGWSVPIAVRAKGRI